ncbi:WD-repeat-containing protein [Hygrophoropsis aurantiaca]|uniref:WD-repeat-containing protein n=1 Tax=Hygrophoropsis aurantiaca TaxID=72124 RepID=A0ACB8ARI2_9AGAM|nr:WD-repeat-containing protein [Hygrophoropsis aurantiaca]
MVQSYLRHGPTQAFGLVCSASSNSSYDGKLAYVPALEDVLVWDMKKGQLLSMWHETGHRAEVTCILRSPQDDVFAVGYADGSIRLWNSISNSVIATFNGHKKAVTALAFDLQGTRLASGSQDTDLIVWDIVAEAGLYRLRGHRDQITAIHFISPSELPSTSTGPTSQLLLSTSKDTLLKLWDLSTQHCMQTIVAHRSEIWTMDINPEQSLIFTGSSEGELKVWSIDREALSEGLKASESGEVNKMIHSVTNIPLSSRHRVSQISFHPSEPYVAVQSHDRSIEIIRIRTEEEIKKKQARRKKRAKEKLEKDHNGGKLKTTAKATEENADADEEINLIDLFTPYLIVRATGKIRSFDFALKETGLKSGVHLLVALATNALEVYSIPHPKKSKEDTPEATRTFSVDIPGHRTDVRTLCLSSDDQLLASASNGSLKLWNLKTTACIRTIDCGYAICSTFLPGDRHIAIGTKSGEILIYDLASSSLSETIKAHSATVWSLHVRADGQAVVSGSADKEVKFWEIENKAILDEEHGPPKYSLSFVHIRTLQMSDDVLSVRYSPNGKLLAVSLLDSTVKVFYQDSLKFFLSLYGHKLPVLSMDISDDSKLIVTCSADKNVKIWGLDFGDCHKSIFAHEESVMQVFFEKKSHYFWTVGKDKMLKYWDGDKFENIQKLDGHHSEIWALAVSHHGKFVVTGSHDKSIRVWEKLDEPLFLEEERERELENIYEAGLADTLNRSDRPIGDSDEQTSAEAAAVTKQTSETLMSGERIMEAIDLADGERAALQEYEDQKARVGTLEAAGLQPPPRNAVLAAYDLEPEAYVLRVVEKVPSTALHDALLVLPFGKVVSLMKYLDLWAQRGWNIVLTSRIIFFLLKTHHHQIVANRIMRTSLIPLRVHLRNALRIEKDTIGYNLAALQHIRRRTEAERTALFFEEHMDEDIVLAKIAEGKKRKRVTIKA